MNERALMGFKLPLLVRIRTTGTVRIETVPAEITRLISRGTLTRDRSRGFFSTFFFWGGGRIRNTNILFNHLRDTHELSRLQTLKLYGVALFGVYKFCEGNGIGIELYY